MQAAASPSNVEKMAGYARQAVSMWLEFAQAGDPASFVAPRQPGLQRYDVAMFGFVRKDPDNEVRCLWLHEDG